MTASQLLPGATDIDLTAADWFQRRKFWSQTEQDEQAFQAWLKASDAHHIAFLRQSAVWESAGRLAALRVPMRKETMVKTPRSTTVLRIAVAVIVCVAMGTAGVSYFERPQTTTYVTPVGGRETIALRDGTKIELNTDSAIEVGAGSSRRVRLVRGEAYFDVRHNAENPFSVAAGSYQVTDLGTKFSINSSQRKIVVRLLEGSAVVAPLDAPKSKRSALLWPGDVAVADSEVLSVHKKSIDTLEADLGWRRGILTFKDTSLADAVAEFNRYNTKKLVVADAGVAGLRINGAFQSQNAEQFAVSMQELFGLRLKTVGNELELSH